MSNGSQYAWHQVITNNGVYIIKQNIIVFYFSKNKFDKEKHKLFMTRADIDMHCVLLIYFCQCVGAQSVSRQVVCLPPSEQRATL